MAVTYGFYNSVDGDRKYNAIDFGSVFDGIISDGVIQPYGDAFKVKSSGGFNITVGSGRAWFNHTWTLNDSELPIIISGSDAALNRWDAVILEVNNTDSVRANSIRLVKGTPAASPSKPTMTNTTDIHWYPLAYIYVAAGASSITDSDITNAVGTTATQYALSQLADPMTTPVPQHRNYFRGKNLGTTFTAAQRAAIKDGSFNDIFVGDYWVIGGITWRIADLDYYLNTGETAMMTTHHAVIVPDNWLYKFPWNDNNNDSIGYFNSKIFSPGMSQADTQSKAAFGTGSIISYEQRFPTIANHGRAIQVTTFKQTRMALMNEVQVYGSYIKSISPSEGLFSIRENFSTTQFALFRLAPQYRIANDPSPTQIGKDGYWLLDTEANGWACRVGGFGDATSRPMDNPCGVRPHFLID